MSFAPSKLSARCLAGNGFGSIPLHLIDSDGCFRGSHPFRDAAGIAAAGLAGPRDRLDIEAALLAAARDGRVCATTSSPARGWTTAIVSLAMYALRRLAMRRRKAGNEALALDAAANAVTRA